MNKIDLVNVGESEFYVYDASFYAGVRPAGKCVAIKVGGRDTNGFLYLFSGSVEFFDGFGKSIRVANAGDLVCIPKGAKYKLRYNEQTHFSLINFNAKEISGNEIGVSDGIVTLASNNTSSDLVRLFDKVEKACSEEGSTTVFKRKELIYRLFSYLSEVFFDFDSKTARIAPGIQMLQQRYLENIPVTELAAVCYVSVCTFRRLFVERYGMSPVQYRNQLRIKRAKALLSDGDYSVSEVAALSGFYSESYFCRYYKKTVGTTPTNTSENN